MKRWIRLSIALVILSASTVTTRAASADEKQPFGIGVPAPDVTVYHSNGEPVSLRELVTGAHSVLVFGCLT